VRACACARVRVRVCVCACACVRARVRACVLARVRVRVRVHQEEGRKVVEETATRRSEAERDLEREGGRVGGREPVVGGGRATFKET
jgi:hypothetical protein